jgi:hypothetical protein
MTTVGPDGEEAMAIMNEDLRRKLPSDYFTQS